MTNFNERLDEILEKFRDSEQYSNGFDGYENIFYTKQAFTSLIKELVEEAKPSYCDGGKKCKCSTEMEQHISSGKETAIIQFEQNLLKALEEV